MKNILKSVLIITVAVLILTAAVLGYGIHSFNNLFATNYGDDIVVPSHGKPNRTKHFSNVTTETTKYTYNLLGQLRTSTFREVKNGEEIASTHTIYEYNTKGQLTLETLYDANNTVLSKVEYSYENSNIVAAKTNYLESSEKTTTFTFDQAGNPICKVSSDSAVKTTYIFTYKEIRISGYAARSSYSHMKHLPETGISVLDDWNYVSHYTFLKAIPPGVFPEGNLYENAENYLHFPTGYAIISCDIAKSKDRVALYWVHSSANAGRWEPHGCRTRAFPREPLPENIGFHCILHRLNGSV